MTDAKGEREEVELPIDSIVQARLVLTDALISATLKAQKSPAARAASKEQGSNHANERQQPDQGDE